MNAPNQGTMTMGATNSKLYEIDASTILSTANQFKNMTDLSHENIKFETLFQQFSLDIGRLDIKIKFIHSLRIFILSFFFILASLGTILFDLTKTDAIIIEIMKTLKYIGIFLPEGTSYYVFLIVNFTLLILYFCLFFFLIYITSQYKHHLCISLSETYAFIILSRVVIPIFNTYISHLFTYSLYNLIFKNNTSESVILVVISIPLLIAQVSFIFISSSAYNATPVIRKHDSTQIWFSQSHFDWIFLILIMVLIFMQTFFKFLSINVASFIFAIISIAISVTLSAYIIIRLPFIYPRTNSIFLSAFLSSPFCSISPILAYYSPSSISYYLVALVILIIISFFVGKQIINHRMIKILKRFDHDILQSNFQSYSSGSDGLKNYYQNNRKNLNFQINVKDDHDLSLLARVGFLFNVPDINNSNFIHFGLEMTHKADFVLSSIQVMLAIQTNNIILASLYQASLSIGKGPFNLTTFRSLFNLMRQEMLTQLNKPLIEAISIAKKANHYLEMTISDFWGDVVKQKTETLLHLLPRITEETIKTELLFLRLARNYPLSPAVYREVVLFYYKTIGDYRKALKFQGLIDKAKSYQYNRPSYNSQQNHLALYSSFSSSSSHSSSDSLEFFDNGNTDLNDLHEKLEPYVLAQDSIMSIPFPPLCWMYATMIITIITVLALPAVILGISISDVQKFQTSFTPIETIGELNMIVARIPQLLRRRNLIEIDNIITPPQDEVGEPFFLSLEYLTKEAINESLFNYHQKLIDETNRLLKLCIPGSTLNKACSEKVHEMNVADSVVMASVFDLLSSFENSLASIISDQGFDWKTASSSSSLLLIMQNFDVLFTSLNSIISTLIDETNDFSKLAKIWLILIWVVPIILILPIAIVTSVLFKREVVFTLKLFFQIPKNEILNLRTAFKKKRHDNQKSRQSQPNQPISATSKTLIMTNASTSTISQTNETEAVGLDNHDDLADSLATVPKQISGLTGIFMLRLFILVLFTCIIVTVGIVVFQQSNSQLISMSNAYASSINVYSSTFASYVWTQEIFAKEPILFTISELKAKSFTYVNEFISKFNDLLYGNSNENKKNLDINPALLLGNDIIETYLRSDSLVFDENTTLYEPSYGIIHMVYITMSCESQMRLFTLNSQWLLDQNSQVSFNFNDLFVYHYEHILFSHLSSFLLDAVSLFEDKINALNDSKTDQLILVFTIVFLIDILYYSTYIASSFRTLLRHLKCPRHLLLLVPPEALLKSQPIVKWMTGIFDSSNHTRSIEMNKNAKKGIEVDFIVHYSDCGLILASSDLKIERVNKTFCDLFKKGENEVIGMNFITFLKKNLFDKDKKLFSWINKEVHKMLEGTSTNYKCQFTSSIFNQNMKLIYISILIEGIQDYGIDAIADMTSPAKMFSIVILDETIQHQLRIEIENEKEKAKSLYNQSFYDHVQKIMNDNESDSFFEIHELTIMFTSITNLDFLLSKTSSDPVEIMAFLNKLYTAYDNEIQNYQCLTKIKSIGSNYMICGGLFTDSEVNTSQIVLNYSLRILSISKKLSENNESGKIDIDITLGVNTGGPVTCGVLGRIRPAFDIAGEAVDIASKMNKYGLPGFIQISESTYNNVKYLNYNLKERGEIQINDIDTIKAYLVSDIPFISINQSFFNSEVASVPVEPSLKETPSIPLNLKISNNESFAVESKQLENEHIEIESDPVENNALIADGLDQTENAAVPTEPDPIDNGQVKPMD